MPTLSPNLDEAERAVRSAIAAKLAAAGWRVATVHHYADSLAAWLAQVGVTDGGRTIARAAVVLFRGFQPMRDDATCAETPIRLRYHVELIRSFTERPSHSEDDFVAKVMQLYQEFERDRRLGFDDAWHTSLETIEEATVEDYDGHNAHRMVLALDVELRKP